MLGTNYILSVIPWWITLALLYFLCITTLTVGRWLFEGHSYNVSLASAYGDIALIGCISIGVIVLKSLPSIGGILGTERFQMVVAVLCLIAGIASNYFLNATEVMDIYHNVVVLPLLAYLLTTTVPVIFKYGTGLEKVATVVLIAIWASLLAIDIATGRLDQRSWLIRRGLWPHNHGGWPKK